jgi:uncharacterized protein (TIGR02266 family)
MRIKLKYPDVDTFIQKYAVNISRGGIFIATKTPKPVGTVIRFEFLLANAEGSAVIRGEGQVQWTREYDAAQPTKAHGMGVKFTKLDGESQAVVERALAYRAAKEAKEAQAVQPAPSAHEPRGRDDVRPAVDDSQPTTLAAGGMDTRVDLPRETAPPEAATAPQPLDSADATTRVATDGAEPTTTRVVVPELRPSDNETTDVRPREPDVPASPSPVARVAERETRPVEIPDAVGAMPERIVDVEDSVRITLARHRQNGNGTRRSFTDEELDALARDWGVTPERLRRVARGRKVRIVEATAELERLLRRPPRVQATRDEALSKLPTLLRR